MPRCHRTVPRPSRSASRYFDRRRSAVTVAPVRPHVPTVSFWPAVRAIFRLVVLAVALLVLVAVYTFLRKDLGAVSREPEHGARSVAIGLGVGGVIGFYDGFFGPGSGSFLIFLFIRPGGILGESK